MVMLTALLLFYSRDSPSNVMFSAGVSQANRALSDSGEHLVSL